MSAKRIVVIASSGGIEALRVIAAGLPGNLPAAICVVLHTAPGSPGMLEAILNRKGALSAVTATNGMRIEEGRIYIAPPDHHLLVEPGVLRTTKGPRENGFRPAIDPLFRSAAQVYGPAAVGVVLTGNLDDGTDGLWAIRRLGGVTIVQDPADALFPSMPRNAETHVDVHYSVPLSEIAPLLARVVTAPAEEREAAAVPEPLEIEVKIAKEENAIDAGVTTIGEVFGGEPHRRRRKERRGLPVEFRARVGGERLDAPARLRPPPAATQLQSRGDARPHRRSKHVGNRRWCVGS